MAITLYNSRYVSPPKVIKSVVLIYFVFASDFVICNGAVLLNRQEWIAKSIKGPQFLWMPLICTVSNTSFKPESCFWFTQFNIPCNQCQHLVRKWDMPKTDHGSQWQSAERFFQGPTPNKQIYPRPWSNFLWWIHWMHSWFPPKNGKADESFI